MNNVALLEPGTSFCWGRGGGVPEEHKLNVQVTFKNTKKNTTSWINDGHFFRSCNSASLQISL